MKIIKNKIFFSKIYFFYCFFTCKLVNFLTKILEVENLLVYKFEIRRYLFKFFFYVFLLIVKKKLNTIYFYKQTYILGINKIMVGVKKNRKIFFNYLHFIIKNDFIKSLGKVSKKNKLRVKINKKFLKIDGFEKFSNKKNLIFLKKMRMSQCFFIFFKRRFKYLENKKLKIKIKVFKKKNYLFKIKKMIRNFGYIRSYDFRFIRDFILKKRKKIFIYAFLKYVSFFSLNLDEYGFMVFFLNSKTSKFLTGNYNEFYKLYFSKFFVLTSNTMGRFLSNYRNQKYKYRYYESRFFKYKYITKYYAIGYAKRRLPKNSSLIKFKPIKYSIEIFHFIITLYYLRTWLKTRYIVYSKRISKNFYRMVTYFFKTSSSFVLKFFRNISLYSNACCFYYLSSNYMKLCRNYFINKVSERSFWKSAWRFHGVFQVEISYLYTNSYYLNELNFFSEYNTIYLYNVFLERHLNKKQYYFNMNSKINNNKKNKNKFDLWFLKKKNRNEKYLINKRSKFVILLKKRIGIFFFLFYDNYFLLAMLRLRYYVFYTFKMKSVWLSYFDVEYKFFLHTYYRKNQYFYGFRYMLPFEIVSKTFFKEIMHVEIAKRKKRVYKKNDNYWKIRYIRGY